MEALMWRGFRGVGRLDSHATVSPSRWRFSYSIGVRIPRLPLAVVEDLEVVEHRVGQLDARLPLPAVESSVCMRPQNDSMTELSKQSPIEPIDATSPNSCARRVNAQEVNWADSIGRRNTSLPDADTHAQSESSA